MWPSDQRLEGGMMTYRGRGHIKVKVRLLVFTNSENNKSAANSKTTATTEELHGNRKKATALQNHGNNMAAKSSPW